MSSVVNINSVAAKDDRVHIVWNHPEKLSITRTFMRLYGKTLKGIVVSQALRVVQDTCVAENTLAAHRVRTSIPGAASFPWFDKYVKLVEAEQRSAIKHQNAEEEDAPMEDIAEEEDETGAPPYQRTLEIFPRPKIRNFEPASYSSVNEFYERNVEFIQDNAGRFTIEQASSIVKLLTGSFGASILGKKSGPIVALVSNNSYFQFLADSSEQSCKHIVVVSVEDIKHNKDVLSEASEIFSIENEGRQFDFDVTRITFGGFVKFLKEGC
jgi:hypothetical protein